MTAILTCVQGDLLAQNDCDAIVNAANAQLLPGGGVCGLIHDAAGPGLARYCAALDGVPVGGAVATPGFDLPQRWVIHACGPRYGIDHPADVLLASAFRHALIIAEQQNVKKVAFPAISTGIYGYPLADAARITVQAIRAELPTLKSINEVRLVLHDRAAWLAFYTELTCGDAGQNS